MELLNCVVAEERVEAENEETQLVCNILASTLVALLGRCHLLTMA